jgi:hypothetical protein
LAQYAPLHQRLHQGDQKQWLAVRPLMQPRRQYRWELLLGKARLQIGRYCLGAQQREGELHRVPVPLQVLHHSVQRMMVHDRLNRPIRPDHQEAGGRPPPGQQHQQV